MEVESSMVLWKDLLHTFLKMPDFIKSGSDYIKIRYFPFGEEKLIASLIAIPNADKANRRQEKGKKLN
jgi:hypothetical protein